MEFLTHEQVIKYVIDVCGFKRNGIKEAIRRGTTGCVEHEIVTRIGIVPDAWIKFKNEFVWFECVKSNKPTEYKLEELYWLDDYMCGTKEKKTGEWCGLILLIYDMTYRQFINCQLAHDSDELFKELMDYMRDCSVNSQRKTLSES